MTLLKGISILLVILYVTIVIPSNTSSQSFNNQVYALDKEIDDAIKKACPTYQGNNIKDLVTDIFKACIPDNTPSPPPTPNPNPTPLDKNIVEFTGSAADDSFGKIVITDTITQKSNSYEVGGDGVSDEFVIPVGNNYKITVTASDPGSVQAEFLINNNRCLEETANTCFATMGSSEVFLNVNIEES